MNALSAVSGGIDLGSIAFLEGAGAALGILKGYGADAHLYIPGVGNIDGIAAGNYLDSAGVTAASVDNPVGLSLDALQAMTLGPELAGLSSAWLTYGTGISLSGGQMIFSSTPAAQYTLKSVSAISAKKTYKLTLTIDSISGGDLSFVVSGGMGVTPKSAPGTYTAMAVSDGIDGPYVFALNGTVNAVVSVASCVEIPGIHATQGTTANKPILRRGLLNLLRQSQALATTPWAARIGTIVATNNFAVGLDGTTTATKLDKTGAVDAAWQQGTDTVMSASTPYTAVFILQKSVTTKIAEVAIRTVLGGIDHSSYVSFDTLSGATYVRVDTGPFAVTVSVADASTYWVIALNKTSASGASADSNIIIRPYIGTTLGGFDDTATGSCVVWRAGLFPGTYTAQQILDAGGIPLTTSAAASSTTGKYWWQFDGSNDSLSLSAPLFQMSDDHCVIAGFKADAANKYIFSHSNSGTASQLCSLRVDVTGFPGVVWIDDATANTLLYGTVSCIGINTVASAIKIGNAKRFRVNGAQSGATNNTVLGTTTLNTYSIGSLNGASGNFQGSIYPIIAIKGTVTDSDLLTLERFVGQLSGVSI